MALASAPSTPERGAAPYLYRRSFTAPTKSTRTAEREAEVTGAETLYTHPAAKIISFTTPPSSLVWRHSSVSNAKSDFHDEPSGTLPWASITERTIAAGALKFYRVLGSVGFLNSGGILHPVLAKSQCWCVDGVSKFVLRIRANTYWRIELPYESRQDEEKVEELKSVLPSILQYEVTACPFKRGFTVDLPEAPATPIQKKPWKPKFPVHNSAEDSPDMLDDVDELEELNEQTSRERYAEDTGLFNGPPAESDYFHPRPITPPPSEPRITGSTNMEFRSETVNESVQTIEKKGERTLDEPLVFKTPTRPRAFKPTRTVTAPPQLSLQTSPPSSKNRFISPPLNQDPEHELSLSSSIESFHSFHSPIPPLPPSPPTSNSSPEARIGGNPNLNRAKIRGHTREASEITITAADTADDPSAERWDLADDWSGDGSAYDTTPELPQTPTIPNINSSNSTMEATPKQLRLRRSRRRPRSPLPSSTNLYSPYSPHSQHHISGHHLTTAILQRTCSLLLGPPVQLVALMLQIAAKIVRGALFQGEEGGRVFRVGGRGERIPCEWEGSSSDEDGGSGSDDNGEGGLGTGIVEGEEEEEDDYGFSLGKTVSGREVRGRVGVGKSGGKSEGGNVGASWEID